MRLQLYLRYLNVTTCRLETLYDFLAPERTTELSALSLPFAPYLDHKLFFLSYKSKACHHYFLTV